MPSTNLKLAATQAGLNPNEKKQVDALSNLLDNAKTNDFDLNLEFTLLDNLESILNL